MKKKLYVYGSEKTCPVCGSSFRKRDADSLSYIAIYCSHACRNKARTKHKEKNCMYCKQVFKPRRDGHDFCSKRCYAEFIEKNHIPSEDVVVNKKMASFCCSCIHRCLRNKTDKTYEMLGYTSKELKAHLESLFAHGMSWSNYGKGAGQWSIDHTRPISSFSADAKVSEINALNNLKPMWHSENCSKGKKWKEH